MCKIIQARLLQYVNWELPDVQAGFRKARGTRDQIANICWIIEKARKFQKKTPTSASLTTLKPLTVRNKTNWKILKEYQITLGFPDSSVGIESAYNAGDPSSIPRSGRSTGKGIGSPLQYSRASLVAQLVRNPLVMRETWVRSLGWEDPLKGKVTHSSILAWKIPWTV